MGSLGRPFKHSVRGVRVWVLLGRALGHFIFSLIRLKRILFTNQALKAPPSLGPPKQV